MVSKKLKHYVSKGQRPNVSKSIRKLVKRNSLPSVEDTLKSYWKRYQVINNPQNKKEKELGKKYVKEQEVSVEAQRLVNRFGRCGLTWAEAVRAIKTDFKDNLLKKWAPILRDWNKKQENVNAFSV